MKAIEKVSKVYGKFYELLYNGIIDENTIDLTAVESCIQRQEKEFIELCKELHDVLISDRERMAFYLTMNFLFA